MFFTLIPTGVLLLWALSLHFPRKNASLVTPSRPFEHLGAVIRTPYALLGALTLLLYVGAEVGISSWVVYYLQQELALGAVASASGLSILWVAIMVGRYANSVLGNRFSSVALVTVSGLAGAVGVVVFLFVETALLAYVVLAWIGLCLSGIFPNVMAELNNRDPEKTGTVTAVMAMGAAIGAGVFQWFVGYVAENASLTAAFVTPAVLQLLLVASFWSAARRR
jgi:FHS family glucose/mannose:H+ symporter-like MFS transporter